MAISSQKYRALLETHRALVEAGYRPDVARVIVLDAAERAWNVRFGMGKVHQLCRVDRENFPGLTPRQSSPGRCSTIGETPGDENATLVKIQQFESQGFNVIRTEPYKDHIVYYACPPGQYPNEAQPLVFQGEMIS
jgi:hypothetical protein